MQFAFWHPRWHDNYLGRIVLQPRKAGVQDAPNRPPAIPRPIKWSQLLFKPEFMNSNKISDENSEKKSIELVIRIPKRILMRILMRIWPEFQQEFDQNSNENSKKNSNKNSNQNSGSTYSNCIVFCKQMKNFSCQHNQMAAEFLKKFLTRTLIRILMEILLEKAAGFTNYVHLIWSLSKRLHLMKAWKSTATNNHSKKIGCTNNATFHTWLKKKLIISN